LEIDILQHIPRPMDAVVMSGIGGTGFSFLDDSAEDHRQGE
jgi:hypothetical protein